MKESFETNLATSTTEETEAKETFASMKASKEEEITAAKELIESKTAELASTDEKNAQAKEDLEDTTATVDADTKFLAALKDKCDSATADYTARTKVRNEEILAVGEAMEILTGDDAKDLLLKFVQRSSKTQVSANRERAAKMVSQLAKKLNKPKLAALSMRMRLDAFTKVKEEIDKMVVSLKQTQKDEGVKKDLCGKELQENEMQTTEKTNLKTDLTTAIADFETSKTTLEEEIAAAQTEMKRASEIRLAENKEFQMTIMDQKSTRQPGYKKNAGSSSVMTMIEHIIEESKEEQKDAIKAENDANAAYAEFNADASASVQAMSESMNNKAEELAKADENHAKATSSLRATEA